MLLSKSRWATLGLVAMSVVGSGCEKITVQPEESAKVANIDAGPMVRSASGAWVSKARMHALLSLVTRDVAMSPPERSGSQSRVRRSSRVALSRAEASFSHFPKRSGSPPAAGYG